MKRKSPVPNHQFNRSLFFLDTVQDINDNQLINLAETHWNQRNESLWFGDIDISQLYLISEGVFNKLYMDEFFRLQYYNFEIETLNVDQGEVPAVEQMCKATHLLTEYLKHGNFRDPICTHYNPRLDVNVVHPGGTRQVILDLFHTGDLKTFYFNTSGAKFNFLNNFEKIDIQTSVLDKNFYISIVPDHGTFVPHIMNIVTGTLKLPENMINTHNRYKKMLNSKKFRLKSNAPMPWWNPWGTHMESKATVNVFFKDPSNVSIKTQMKATLLILGNHNYEDEDLKIVSRYEI